MSDDNVFAPTDAIGEANDPAEQILAHLRQTRPWVAFLSFLGGLSSAMLVVMGISFVVIGLAAGQAEILVAAGLGALYVALGGLYAVGTVLLGRFAAASAAVDLEGAARAIRYQRDFWRFVGVLTLAVLALYCGGVLLALVALVPGG